MGVQLTQEMINASITAQQKYGVPASVTLGQIILESGGNYPGGLSALAYNDNNLFGIKAGSSWTGKTTNYNTQEVDQNGKTYTTKATFRKYNNVAESIDDHGRLLASPIYTSKTNGATNLNDYVNAMGSVYATSPTYAKDLMNVINSNNLTKYDSKNYAVTQTGVFNNNSNIGWLEDAKNTIFTKVVKVTVILLIILASLVFFLKAFDVSTTKVAKKVATKVVEKKTGVDVSPVVDAIEGGVMNE